MDEEEDEQAKRDYGRREWLVLILFTLAMVIMFLFAAIKLGYFKYKDTNNGWIETYQTLLAGLLAIAAALIGAYFVHRQTTLQSQAEHLRIKNRELATRVKLPHLMDEVNAIFSRNLTALTELRRTEHGGRIPRTSVEFHRLEPGLIGRIADALEGAAPGAQDALSDLVIAAQWIFAQLEGIQERLDPAGTSFTSVLVEDIDRMAVNFAALYARSYDLYEYGRGSRPVSSRIHYDAEIASVLRIEHYAVESAALDVIPSSRRARPFQYRGSNNSR